MTPELLKAWREWSDAQSKYLGMELGYEPSAAFLAGWNYALIAAERAARKAVGR